MSDYVYPQGMLPLTAGFRANSSEDSYPMGINNELHGGLKAVKNWTELLLVPNQRLIPLFTFALIAEVDAGNGETRSGLFKLDSLPAGGLPHTSANWSEIELQATVEGGLQFKGFFDPSNYSIQDATGEEGFMYVVENAPQPGITVNDPGLFGGVPTTVVTGDQLFHDGTVFMHLDLSDSSGVNWDNLPGKPQALLDYVNGIIISHDHDSSEVDVNFQPQAGGQIIDTLENLLPLIVYNHLISDDANSVADDQLLIWGQLKNIIVSESTIDTKISEAITNALTGYATENYVDQALGEKQDTLQDVDFLRYENNDDRNAFTDALKQKLENINVEQFPGGIKPYSDKATMDAAFLDPNIEFPVSNLYVALAEEDYYQVKGGELIAIGGGESSSDIVLMGRLDSTEFLTAITNIEDIEAAEEKRYIVDSNYIIINNDIINQFARFNKQSQFIFQRTDDISAISLYHNELNPILIPVLVFKDLNVFIGGFQTASTSLIQMDGCTVNFVKSGGLDRSISMSLFAKNTIFDSFYDDDPTFGRDSNVSVDRLNCSMIDCVVNTDLFEIRGTTNSPESRILSNNKFPETLYDSLSDFDKERNPQLEVGSSSELLFKEVADELEFSDLLDEITAMSEKPKKVSIQMSGNIRLDTSTFNKLQSLWAIAWEFESHSNIDRYFIINIDDYKDNGASFLGLTFINLLVVVQQVYNPDSQFSVYFGKFQLVGGTMLIYENSGNNIDFTFGLFSTGASIKPRADHNVSIEIRFSDFRLISSYLDLSLFDISSINGGNDVRRTIAGCQIANGYDQLDEGHKALNNPVPASSSSEPLTGEGSPYGVVTPDGLHQEYQDTLTKLMYKAKTIHPKGWEVILTEQKIDLEKSGLLQTELISTTNKWYSIIPNILPNSRLEDGVGGSINEIYYNEADGTGTPISFGVLIGAPIAETPAVLYATISGIEIELNEKSDENGISRFEITNPITPIPQEIIDAFKNQEGTYLDFKISDQPDPRKFIIDNSIFFYDASDESTIIESGGFVQEIVDISSNQVAGNMVTDNGTSTKAQKGVSLGLNDSFLSTGSVNFNIKDSGGISLFIKFRVTQNNQAGVPNLLPLPPADEGVLISRRTLNAIYPTSLSEELTFDRDTPISVMDGENIYRVQSDGIASGLFVLELNGVDDLTQISQHTDQTNISLSATSGYFIGDLIAYCAFSRNLTTQEAQQVYDILNNL